MLPDGDFEGEAPRDGGPRPRGTWWREAPVPAAAFVLCLLGAVVRVDDTLAPPPAVAYVIAVLSCAVLPLRHRAPMATLAATTASGVLVQPLGLLLSPLTAAPAVIAVYSCALTARSERRAAGAVSLASAVLLAASTPLVGDLSWQDASRMGSVAAFPLVAGLLGHSVRNRRACLAAVEERARRAEESRDSEARMRVAEERVRIARELHDLVAHQITLANAQATVAAHLFDTRPEQTRKSLGNLSRQPGTHSTNCGRRSGCCARPATRPHPPTRPRAWPGCPRCWSPSAARAWRCRCGRRARRGRCRRGWTSPPTASSRRR